MRATLAGPLGRTLLQLAATVLIAWAIGAALRYGLVQRDDLGALCESAAAPGWCALRLLVIRGFVHDVYALASLGFAALAFWPRGSRGFRTGLAPLAARLAIASGTVGMVLYTFTWSAVGFLAGTLALARLHERREHGEPERRAG